MAIGASDTLWGQTKVSAAEAKEHEDLLLAKRIVEIPSNLQMRADYGSRSDSQPEHLGFAARGTASSDTSWLLHKFTYDGSNRVTLRQIAYDSWDNIATATYS